MEYGETTRLPVEALPYLRQGDKEMREQNMNAAARSYVRALSKAPKSLLPHLLAGVALLASSQPKIALPLLRKAVQLKESGESDIIAFRLLQGALVDSGDSLAADTLEREMARRDLSPSYSIRRLLEWALQLPESPGVFLLLGDAHQLAGEWNEAERAYQKSTRLAPKWVRPRLNSAMALLAHQQAPAATLRLEEALRLEPRNDQAQYFLGDAYLSSGRNQEAIDAYRKVQKASPLALQAQLNIAQAHAEMKNYPAAVSSLSNAEKMAPQDPMPSAAIGELKMRQGEPGQAAASFSSALQKKVTDPSLRPLLLKQLANAYLQDKKYDAAEKTVQQGMAESIQEVSSWYLLRARIAAARGDRGSVEEFLKKSLENDTELYASVTLGEIEKNGLAGKLLAYYQSLVQNTSGGVQVERPASPRTRATIRSVETTPQSQVGVLRAFAHLSRNASLYGDEVRAREELVRLRPEVTEFYLLALAYDHNNEVPNAIAYYNKTMQLLNRSHTANNGGTSSGSSGSSASNLLPRSEVEHLQERLRLLRSQR